jgi:hypothetical protein
MRCGMSSSDNESSKSRSNVSWDLAGTRQDVQHVVKTRQTTIIVKPGEDLEQRGKQTQDKFARNDVSIPASVRRG